MRIDMTQTRAQVSCMVCSKDPGLFAFCNRGVRYDIITDPDFPVTSLYAHRVLRGDLLNDDRDGSYQMKRSLVIKVAARHGLGVVNVLGDLYWSDDVAPIP